MGTEPFIETVDTCIVDIPLRRPHVMSFGSPREVNFVLVRVEAKEMMARGHRIFKIKMGAGPVEKDVAKLALLRRELGPEVGLRADVTPPDAVTDFAAANIAGCEPMSTGFQAFSLGFAGFLVPFAFVLNPELLLAGTPGSIVLMTLKTIVAVIWLAGGIIGQFLYPLTGLQRCLFAGAAALLIWPGLLPDVAGLVLFLRARPWRRNAGPLSE